MPRPIMLALLPLAACADAPGGDGAPAATAPTSLVGLYERAGVPGRPSRICIGGAPGAERFGISTSYEGPQSCTAMGRVRRERSKLTLLIDGDPACSLSATVTGAGVTLDDASGPECPYYCGADTRFDPGPFAKVGSTAADARRAVDVAGEPLCPG